MEIIFITNDRFRKLNMIFRLFGAGILTQAEKEFPAFFGKTMELSSHIFDESISIPGHQSVWDACFDSDPVAKLAEIAPAVAGMLDKLDIPMADEKDPFFTELKDAINAGFSGNENAISNAIQSVFRFELPKRLVLIMDKYGKITGSYGHKLAVNKDTGVIGYSISASALSRDRMEPVSVILHEMLHVLISKYKIVKHMGDSKTFEEAFIRYFAPYGMLTAKLGLQPDRWFEDYLKQISGFKSYSYFAKLTEVMSAYSRMPYGTDIWDFLDKNGLGEYIDTSRLPS
ncbi:MAG: hypothetical protein BK997_01135 [Candidatus Micrarchaeum sp. ARMAN-1]|nr:MAG: hypothetical protein BK997_01135 [Candidatus Micrarchaeum sp. ARMAN-1]